MQSVCPPISFPFSFSFSSSSVLFFHLSRTFCLSIKSPSRPGSGSSGPFSFVIPRSPSPAGQGISLTLFPSASTESKIPLSLIPSSTAHPNCSAMITLYIVSTSPRPVIVLLLVAPRLLPVLVLLSAPPLTRRFATHFPSSYSSLRDSLPLPLLLVAPLRGLANTQIK